MSPLPTILRLARRNLSRRLLQSVLFVLGVALGVAMVVSIDLANLSAKRGFLLSTRSLTGEATHQVIGGMDGLPTDLYRQLRVELGLRQSAPVVEGYVPVAELGGQPLRLLGVDAFADAPFRSYLTNVSVSSEVNLNAADALNRFVATPNTVLMSETLANRFGIRPGDSLTLTLEGGAVSLRVVGTLNPEDAASAQALENLLLADIATAQAVIGQPGRISRIDLILPDGYDAAPLEAILPAGARLARVTEESSAIAQMTAAFELNLQALSLLALVVGAFLIYNTVTFNVVQRRPVIGTLRSLGTTRAQIFILILSEAALLALIGTVIGLALGVILGRFTVQIVSLAISNLYFTSNVQTVNVDLFTLVKGAFIGMGISLVAALIPSWDATRTAPVGVMRRSELEDQAQKLLPLITGVALAMNVLGLGLLAIPSKSVVLSFAALFCIVVGSALFTPILLVGVMRAIVPLTERVFGLLGRMAPRAVERSLSRTSVAVAALTVAVSVIVGVSVMIASFRTTVADWLDSTLGADIFIAPPSAGVNQFSLGMPAEVMDQVAAVDGIERVSAARQVTAIAPDYPDQPPANLIAITFDIAPNRRFVWNTFANSAEGLAAGQVMVSEPFAFRRGITPENNTVRLMTDNGEQTFTVFGVIYDYTTDQGAVYMQLDTYHTHWNDRRVSNIGAFITPGADLEGLVDTLETETLADQGLIVQSNRSLREGVFVVFDQAFSITIALRLLATIVAFIGILSALLALQLENTRQYGLMRAIGLTPAQLGRFTLIQTGLMGFTSGLLALPIGLALAAVLIFVINVRSFGWSMGFMPLPGQMAQAFTVAISAALIAGVYPAWRLGRLVTARALRAE
ncbi:MAG: ABC transporter permease [Phototrophicaceae bacterium]